MDELLHDRVKQLREIQDRIDRALQQPREHLSRAMVDLRWELDAMIRAAEEEYAAF